jgi:hypothetical protein
LSWGSQAAKLRNNKQRFGCVDINIPSKGGCQTYHCIPVRKLPGFLATINPLKVKNSLRSKVVMYQTECDDVLWDYWTKGKAINPRPRAVTKMPLTLTEEQESKLDELILDRVKFWNPKRHELGRDAIHRAIENHFQVETYKKVPQDKFDEMMALVCGDHPRRAGIAQDVENHIPNIIDDLLQFLLYRIDGIAEEIGRVHNTTTARNIVIELTMMTSALGAVFPEEMQWLRLGQMNKAKK